MSTAASKLVIFLAFANSSGNSWSTYNLTISNYLDSTEAIYFGVNTNGLTAGQLANVRWENPYGTGGLVLGAIIESDGRIRPAPVPELNTVIAFALMGVGGSWKNRRKLLHLFTTVRNRYQTAA